jgi:YbbR domain-containing protein
MGLRYYNCLGYAIKINFRKKSVMNKNSWILMLIGALVLVSLYFFLKNSNSQNPAPSNQTNSSQTAGSRPASTQTPEPQVVEVAYNSSNANFHPQTFRVEEGTKAALKITSDIADELHFHGYDLHIDLEANKQGQINFSADKTGRFEFELENHKKTLGVIEVYPKQAL